MALLLSLFSDPNPLLFFAVNSARGLNLPQNMLDDGIKGSRHIRLQILLFFHEREFRKNLGKYFKEPLLVSLLTSIGLEYSFGQYSYEIIKEVIVDLLLISYCKA